MKTRYFLFANFIWVTACFGAETLVHYYAHPAVADKYGVIAPW
jgi:hypothetical protein